MPPCALRATQSPCRHTPGKGDEFSDLVGDGPVPEDLAPHRAPYAVLARHLARRGCEVSTGRPERAAAFCAETKEWPQGEWPAGMKKSWLGPASSMAWVLQCI